MTKFIQRLILTLILFCPVLSLAAEDISVSDDGRTVTITDVTNDWTWTDTFTDDRYENGIRVNYIRFHPGGTDDTCIIEDADDAEVKHFYCICADKYDDRIQYYNGALLKLFIDQSDGDYDADTTESITIQLWGNQ